MTYAALKALLRTQIWSSGEQENLIGAHDAFFEEAMWDLQAHIPCLQFSANDTYAACATYFNCGLTVLPQPQGKILRVYVIDRIDPETGLESATGEDEWCQKVVYSRVHKAYLDQYLKLCERCSTSPISESANAIFTQLFGIFRRKTRYPKPTDEGMSALPALPNGFHYPQTSTNANGRSPGGVYATHGGRLYLGPWIQSTETVVVEFVGLKRQWNDADLVEDDPKFRQAVRLHVAHQHESTYGEPSKAALFHVELYGDPGRGVVGVIPTLIHECHEQNRAISSAEGSQGGGSSARGVGTQTVSFYNDTRAEVTVTCPVGKTGGPFTVVKDVGSVASALSIQDANARAMELAQEEANARLASCVTPEVTYWNTEQQGFADCPGVSADGLTPAATGDRVTVTEPANLYSSTVSQEAANALAVAAAVVKAAALLQCTFHNRAQTRCFTCPGVGGSENCVTIDANQPEYDSTLSQDDADRQAGIAAQSEANSGCISLDPLYVTVSNSFQNGSAQGTCRNPNDPLGGIVLVTASGVCQAGVFRETVLATEADAARLRVNQLARDEANFDAANNLRCPPGTIPA